MYTDQAYGLCIDLLNCKFCQQEITFDDEHFSKKTNRKVPLDPFNRSPHHCEESREAYRSEHPLKCRMCKETEIYFDAEYTSISAKMIPLEVATNLPHNCPKSKWNLSHR